jgi:hypothetical protein
MGRDGKIALVFIGPNSSLALTLNAFQLAASLCVIRMLDVGGRKKSGSDFDAALIKIT